jgi:hypothetical protein
MGSNATMMAGRMKGVVFAVLLIAAVALLAGLLGRQSSPLAQLPPAALPTPVSAPIAESDLVRRREINERLAQMEAPATGAAVQPKLGPVSPSPPSSPPPAVAPGPLPSPANLMPEFPWPPPRASAWDVIPNEMIVGTSQAAPTFAVVRDRLTRALDSAGYFQRSFFSVPNGFAVVTQLERVGADGAPAGERRWLVDSASVFSLEGYLKKLLFAEPGRYRLVVLLVTDVSFSTSGDYITASDAREMVTRGVNDLPQQKSEEVYSVNHRCTALIYEFRKGRSAEPELVLPSPDPGRVHLVKARMWAALENVLGRR